MPKRLTGTVIPFNRGLPLWQSVSRVARYNANWNVQADEVHLQLPLTSGALDYGSNR